MFPPVKGVSPSSSSQVHVPAGGADTEDGDGGRPSEPVVLQVPRLSVFQTAWVFFKTFFASLVPEAPQGIAN